MGAIEIREGSLLDFEGDTIVNPANGFLMHGAGLARVIANAARGPALPNPGMGARERLTPVAKAWDDEQRQHPTIATGNVGVTSAGVLPYKGIIHAVGPVYNGGGFHEHDLLHLAHVSALEAAIMHGWRSIAFPAISCGLFGFPVAEAAPIAVQAASLAADVFDVIAFYPFGFEAEYTAALQAQEGTS